MAKKIAGFAVAAAAVLAAVVIFRTVSLKPQPAAPQMGELAPIDAQAAAERLAATIRFKTISYKDDAEPEMEDFRQLHDYVESAFPGFHSAAAREVIAGRSLLYVWPGSDAALAPLLLLAHLDVVPIESEGEWSHEPFGGAIDGGYLWGRGTLDDKSNAMAILEAAERLAANGFQPRRTIYAAFGHDEEIGGSKGASEIARILKERGVKPFMVLDEGGSVLKENPFGVNRRVALVGVAEKGFLNLDLSVNAEGGHSSIPPKQTAVGILSAAIQKLESNPYPASLSEPARMFLETIGPELDFAKRMATSNLWLFGGMLKSKLSESPATDAGIRTTVAPTVFQGGVKGNVLPKEAKAVVNFRILPGDTVESVKERAERVIDDPRVKIAMGPFRSEPSPVSRVDSEGFRLLEKSILQIFPDAVTTPFLVLGATDSRHYVILGADTYRFAPLLVSPGDLTRIHGVDERLAVDNYGQMIQFYIQLIRNACAEAPASAGP